VNYPRIPGHEVSARIIEIGQNVQTDLQVGQDVLVMPYSACGECTSCRSGRTNCCQFNQTLGVQRDGAMAEFVVTQPEKLIAASALTLAELALVEPLTIGFHAVDRGRVSASDTVAVLGCGAIGLGVIAGVVVRGARVIAIDVDDAKLALASKCGATHGINSNRESPHDRLAELTNGDGPNVIVEAIGLPQTFQLAVNEVCFAGRVVYVGYAKAAVEYETKHFILKELDILGSRNALQQDFLNVIQFLQAGTFPVSDVISHTTDLAGASALLREWSECPANFTKIHVVLD
jgi:L-galactonate 5-dehydrogenase